MTRARSPPGPWALPTYTYMPGASSHAPRDPTIGRSDSIALITSAYVPGAEGRFITVEDALAQAR